MIPFPKLQSVRDQAKNGVPAAQLLMTAVAMLQEFIEQNEDRVFELIRERARDDYPS